LGTLLFQAKGAYNDSEIVKMKRLALPTAIVAVLTTSPILAMPGYGLG